MTMRALEKEVLELPPRSRLQLAEKILERIDDFADPGIANLWDSEIQSRIAEIRSGDEKGIPADEVMESAHRAVHETRHLSSSRRK